jgi:negative regulator of flagellin synthesis FlgM
MKINDIHRAGRIQAYQNQAGAGSNVVGRKPRQKDELVISSAAKELLQASAGSAARAEKIAELKRAVSAGTYHVDARRIADKLLPYLQGHSKD